LTHGLVRSHQCLVATKKTKLLAPETNAEQRSKTNIPIKPNIRSVSNVYAKLKLGSNIKKRLVKQSKWQIIDRQAIILCVKVSVFVDSELSICLLFSLPF
jgi:hypothetical protein